MKTLPLRLEAAFSGACIDFVSEQRMVDIGHVDADLMGPAGLQPALHIRV